MGGSSSKVKRWMTGGVEKEGEADEKSVKKFATPFVYTKNGSMYFDEDGDLAHEFYEEVPSSRRGIKARMKKIIHGLTPQGEIKLQFPCLNVEFPIIIYQDM